MKSIPIESMVATRDACDRSQSAPNTLAVWSPLNSSSNSFLSKSKRKRLPFVPPIPRYLPLDDSANLPDEAGMFKF